MKKIKDSPTGATITVDDTNLTISMPIQNLVNGFELDPNNYDEWTIKPRCKKKFAEWVAEYLTDEADQNTGDDFIAQMFSNLFLRLFDGDYYEDSIIDYPEED